MYWWNQRGEFTYKTRGRVHSKRVFPIAQVEKIGKSKSPSLHLNNEFKFSQIEKTVERIPSSSALLDVISEQTGVFLH